MEIASQRTMEEKTSQDHVDEEVGLLCIHSLGEHLWVCLELWGILLCVLRQSLHKNQAILGLDMRYRLE